MQALDEHQSATTTPATEAKAAWVDPFAWPDNAQLLRSPSTYLKCLSKRLAYLHEKRAEKKKAGVGVGYLDEECDALFWLMAEYALASGYDVRGVIERIAEKTGVRMKLWRYDEVLHELQARRARAEERRRLAAMQADEPPEVARRRA